MARLQWIEEADRLVVDAAPESDVSAVLCVMGVCSLIFWAAGQRSGNPDPLWMAPLGLMVLILLSLRRRERCEFLAQGCRVRRTTLGPGGTRSFEATQRSDLPLEWEPKKTETDALLEMADALATQPQPVETPCL